MTNTPFRDTAKRIARSKDYMSMSFESGRVRSHGWWKNLVEYGAWGGPNSARTGPPTPETFDGIATLFGTTQDQVRHMIAADWYGVTQDSEIPLRALQVGQLAATLDDEDLEIVENLIKRLGRD